MTVVFVILVFLLIVVVIAIKQPQQEQRRHEPPPVRELPIRQPDPPAPQVQLTIPQEIEPNTWLVNPGFSFELTVYPVARSTADELVSLLRQAIDSYDHKLTARLTALVARHNIRCREIDLYVAEYRPKYKHRINEQIGRSAEWAEASERDREDLLSEYRDEALEAVQVRPDVDLITLFEGEPSDRTVDDQLIDAYGFDEMNIYLRHAAKLGKVHTIDADNYRRPFFERLVERGLAVRGKDVPLAAVLDGLKIKEMQALVTDLDAPVFRRKAAAIEYLLSVSDILPRLDATISFRELFQLKPLPPPFDTVDLDLVATAWEYDAVIAELLQRTYVMGFFDTRNHHEDVSGIVKRWRISSCGDGRCCAYCRSLESKTFPRAKKPRTPLHLACRCTVVMAD